MRASSAIILALFSNFFGWFIVQWYMKSIDTDRPSLFIAEEFFTSSIIEMAVIFVLCVSYFVYRKHNIPKLSVQNLWQYDRGALFWLLTILLASIGFVQLVTSNFSFDLSLRGVNQFDRGLFTALQRALLLIFPVFLFYRIAYRRFPFARRVALFLALSIIINSMLLGDRRLILYFVLSYAFILIRERELLGTPFSLTAQFKRYLMIFFGVVFFLLVYLTRFNTGANTEQLNIIYIALQGTIGALGIGAILPEIKSIVANQTGFLSGRSFITYAWTLFVPSFLIYLYGGNEFVFRSAYEFDAVFNDNKNMGYDFMMLADFFWNFGYLGYGIYLLITLWVIRTVTNYEHSFNDRAFGLVVILAVFFIAGQRSDFGFFLKSTVYCGLVFYILFAVAHRRLIQVKQWAT